MSEIQPPDAQLYAEKMSQAFCTPTSESPATSPFAGLDSYEKQTKNFLDEVDWEASGLPPVQMLKGDYMVPREFSQKLREFAFKDGYTLIRCCKDFVERFPLPGDVDFGTTLKASKRLLDLARLKDDDKYVLVRMLKYSLPSNEPDRYPIRLVGSNHNLAFTWQPAVAAWIKRNSGADRGCPAASFITATCEGGRQTVLQTFWENLVDAMYPQSQQFAGLDGPHS